MHMPKSSTSKNDEPEVFSDPAVLLQELKALGKERSGVGEARSVAEEARWLKIEMDITIEEVGKSQFYKKFTSQLVKDKIENKINDLLKPERKREPKWRMQMVIYGLGSMEYNYISQYQLALAILLKRNFKDLIGEVQVFDPMMSPADCEVVKLFKNDGFSVLATNEQCKRRVEKPTLFYLPCLDHNMFGNLLEANWSPAGLNKMVILSNSFEYLAKNHIRYVEAIKNHVMELKIGTDYRPNIIEKFSWHFFNLKPDLDLNKSLPAAAGGRPDSRSSTSTSTRSSISSVGDFQRDYKYLRDCVTRSAKESFEESDSVDTDLEERSTSTMPSFWRPPPARWIKLNFSGKVVQGNPPRAGFGGIFRDEHERCLAMYSGSVAGAANTADANPEALKQGLRFVESYPSLSSQVKKLLVEGDEVQIIRWMKGGPDPPPRVAQVSKEIDRLEKKKIMLQTRQVYEEANSMAIKLAERGARLKLWVPPSPVK